MTLSMIPALSYSWDALAKLMTDSFAEYWVEIKMTPQSLAFLCLSEGVDLRHSRVVLRDQEPVGLGLIAQRGWSCRLAAMGIVKEVRHSGVGRHLLQALIDEARARGQRRMILEVIEQNTPAIQLYRGCGFQTRRRLIGFHAQAPSSKADPRLQQVDGLQVARAVFEHGPSDLPWQLAPETLIHLPPPFAGVQLDQACALTTDPAQESIALRSLLVTAQARRQGQATRLLQALFARYPGKRWRVPVIVPEDAAPGLLEGLGFQRETLSQLEMVLPLS